MLPSATDAAHPLWRWSLPILAASAVLAGLWAASTFVIPVVCALVLGVLLWPAVCALDRVLRVRALSALVAVTATLVAVVGLVVVVGNQLSDAADATPNALRLVARDIGSLDTADRTRAVQRTRAALRELDRSVARATGTGAAQPEDTASGSLVTWLVDAAASLALRASKSIFTVTLQAGVMALLTFFGLCSAEALVARCRAMCAAVAPRPQQCTPLLAEAARQVRLFAWVTVVTNVCIGLGVAAIFAMFGVPEAWMWGLTAAVLHFVPYAGLAVVMALASLEVYVVQASLGAALLAATCVAAVGVAIGTAMSVWLQGRAGRVDSASLFAGTVFWSVLWGGWGLMLGPLLVVVMQLAWRRLPTLRSAPAEPARMEPVPKASEVEPPAATA